MIGRSFWALFGALSCQSSSIAQQSGVRLQIHIFNYWTGLVVVERAEQARSPSRAINCLVPWGTEAIPRVR